MSAGTGNGSTVEFVACLCSSKRGCIGGDAIVAREGSIAQASIIAHIQAEDGAIIEEKTTSSGA